MMKIIMTKIFIKRFLRFILRIFYCLNLRVYTNILIGEKMNEKEIIRGWMSEFYQLLLKNMPD